MSDEQEMIWASDQIAQAAKRIAARDDENAKDRAQIADWEAYIRVLAAKSGPKSAFMQAAAAEPIKKRSLSDLIDASRKGAKKRAILTTLKSLPNGAQTGWILGAIKLLGIEGATQENTSPQLSAYKADGLLMLRDDFWIITEKGRAYLAEKN